MDQLLYDFSTQINTLSLSDKMVCALIVSLLCMIIVLCVLTLIMFLVKTLQKVNTFTKNNEQKQSNQNTQNLIKNDKKQSEEEQIAAVIACINIMLEQEKSENKDTHFVVNKIYRKNDNKKLWQNESRIGQ